MNISNPSSAKGDTELEPLAPRVEEIEGKRIGLYDNGKMAAEPVLEVLREKLDETYDDVEFEQFSLNVKSDVQDPDKQAAIEAWAHDEIDVCIGAIGDCGSCTKFLTWGMQIVEEAGVPTVGLIDEGFELDFQSNAIERGIPLRYNKEAVRSEVRDHDLIAERLTPDTIDAIANELTRPRTDKETSTSNKNAI